MFLRMRQRHTRLSELVDKSLDGDYTFENGENIVEDL